MASHTTKKRTNAEREKEKEEEEGQVDKKTMEHGLVVANHLVLPGRRVGRSLRRAVLVKFGGLGVLLDLVAVGRQLACKKGGKRK